MTSTHKVADYNHVVIGEVNSRAHRKALAMLRSNGIDCHSVKLGNIGTFKAPCYAWIACD